MQYSTGGNTGLKPYHMKICIKHKFEQYLVTLFLPRDAINGKENSVESLLLSFKIIQFSYSTLFPNGGCYKNKRKLRCVCAT